MFRVAKNNGADAPLFTAFGWTAHLGRHLVGAFHLGAPPKRLQGISDLLADVTVLDVTPLVSRKFGEIQASLLDIGKPAPEMDLLIGATALVHDLTLVTHNLADYANIKNLRLVDWLSP